MSRSRSRNVRWEAMEEQFDPALKVRRMLAQSAPLAWTELGGKWSTPEDVAAYLAAVGGPEMRAAAARVGARIRKESEVDSAERLIAERQGGVRPAAAGQLRRARKGASMPRKTVQKDPAVEAAIASNKAEAAKANGRAVKKSAKAPEWKSLRGDELHAYLSEHKTLGDSVWADIRESEGLPATRNEKETRQAFLDRVFGKAS